MSAKVQHFTDIIKPYLKENSNEFKAIKEIGDYFYSMLAVLET
jgi:hypothetical protein